MESKNHLIQLSAIVEQEPDIIFFSLFTVVS